MLNSLPKSFLILSSTALLSSCAKEAYMFTSFREPATDGLHFLYSYDGYKWQDAGKSFLTPQVGPSRLMRDPSITQGPDGTYHLVWTCGWKGDKGFGYARLKDLVHWSEQRFIDVMSHEPSTVNVWAPEIFYDPPTQQFLIVWASTIPLRFPKGQEEEENNHRLYYTTTKDFKTFSATKLYLDPGFSAIDSEVLRRGVDDYVLIVKDNTRPERDIKVAFGPTATGPFLKVSEPFTANFTEGPSVAKLPHNQWLIYYDAYREKKYGAAKTTDFKTFTDVSAKVSVPTGHKHGTIFTVPRKTLKNLLQTAPVGAAGATSATGKL